MFRLDRTGLICAVAVAVGCGNEATATTPAPGAERAEMNGSAAPAAGTGSSAAGRVAQAGVGAAGIAAAGSGGARAAAGANAGIGGAGAPALAPEPDDAGVAVDASEPEEPDAGSEVADAGPPACADCCRDGFARGSAKRGARKIAALTPSPEGIAVCPDGKLYVAIDASGEVWHVPLDGARPERWATLGDRRPAGLTCDARGRLFVATFASKSGAKISLGAVMITGKDATPVELPQPSGGAAIGGLNGIVAVLGAGVYASDSPNSALILMQEDAAGSFSTRIVAKDVNLANGLAYAAQTRTLYANASGAGQLLSFQVAADGALGERKQVRVAVPLLFMDGVAVDEKGDAYVADWLGGQVVRVATGESVAAIANPASLAFRGGTLLITDYKLSVPDAAGGVYAVELGVCGAQ